MMGFWMLRGYSSEGRKYVRAALELPAVKQSDFIHAHALYVGAALADCQGNHAEARTMLEACLALRRGLGEPVDIAAALSTLSLVRLHTGDAQGALEGEAEALGIFRKIGERIGEAIGLHHLGQIHAYSGDDAQARRYLEECLAIARALAYSEIEGECEINLGELELDAGDLPSARNWFSLSLGVSQDAGDRRGEATALWWMAKADLAGGDPGAARSRLAGALRAFQAFEMYEETLGCLEDYASLLQSIGRGGEAARLYAAVEASRERLALPRPPRSERRLRGEIAAVRAKVETKAFDAAWSSGSTLEVGEAVAFVLALDAVEPATA